MPQRRQRDDKIQPTRHYSKRQENQVASKFGGERTLNSGATTFQKGDILLEDYLMEAKTKTTHSNTITIHKEWLDKLRKESLFMGKPNEALIFNFGPNETNYVIISEDLFYELINTK